MTVGDRIRQVRISRFEIGRILDKGDWLMIRILLSTRLGERRMTQTELARATGIRAQTINELYHDFAERISLDDLDLICEALDCSIDELIVREPNEELRVTEVRRIPKTVNKARKK